MTNPTHIRPKVPFVLAVADHPTVPSLLLFLPDFVECIFPRASLSVSLDDLDDTRHGLVTVHGLDLAILLYGNIHCSRRVPLLIVSMIIDAFAPQNCVQVHAFFVVRSPERCWGRRTQ